MNTSEHSINIGVFFFKGRELNHHKSPVSRGDGERGSQSVERGVFTSVRCDGLFISSTFQVLQIDFDSILA